MKETPPRWPTHLSSLPVRRLLLVLWLALAGTSFPGLQADPTIATATGPDFTVNSTSDTVDANTADGICADSGGNCSLRAAIMQANATAGTQLIAFAASTNGVPITLTLPGQNEDAAATGDLDIAADLTITGNGMGNTIIQGCDVVANESCTGVDRLFHILETATVSIEGVTMRNGRAAEGGGISNDGTLHLTGVRLTGNSTAGGNGGGILNRGTLTITASTIVDNTAGTESGGGIFNNSSGTLTIARSLLTGNMAATGGGLASFGAAVIANSTLSGNTAANGGGAVRASSGTTTVRNSTIADSVAPTGRSFMASAGVVTIANSIVQSAGANNCSQPLTSVGHNLSNDTSCGFTAAGDQPNTDALLDPLADNGGQTQTYALQSGSPAFNAGDNAVCTAAPVSGLDQRGVTRPQGAACDSGAFEANATGFAASVPAASVPTSWEFGETKLLTLTVTNTGGVTWNATGTNPVVLMAQFRAAAGATATNQRLFPLAADVPAGGSASFTDIAIAAPLSAATILELAMVRQGAGVIPNMTTVAVTVAAPSGTIGTAGVPDMWLVGTAKTFAVGVENDGAAVWPAAGSTRVVLRARFTGQPDKFFALPADVEPAATANVSVMLTAPAASGETAVELALVKQGANAVFGNVSVAVSVRAPFAGTLDVSGVPSGWVLNKAQTFSVVVENTGGTTWTTSGGDRVLVRVKFGATGTYKYFALPGPVASDGIATVDVTLTAPATSGSTSIELALWHPAGSTAFALETINVTVGAAHQGTFATTDVPLEFTAGKARTFTLGVQNTAGAGGATWQTSGPGRVLVRAKLDGQPLAYSDLSGNVAPGGTGSADVTLTAPAGAGQLPLELALVVAGQGDPFAAVTVTVGIVGVYRGTIDTTGVSAGWTPNRAQTFTITVQNSALSDGNTWGAGAGQPGRVLLRTRFVQRDAGQNVTANSPFAYTDLAAAPENETAGRVKPSREPLESATATVTMQAPGALGPWEMELALLPAGTAATFSTVYAPATVGDPVQGTIDTAGIPAEWTRGRSPAGATVTVTNTAPPGGMTWTLSGSGRVLVRVQVNGQPFQYFALPESVAPGESTDVDLPALRSVASTGPATVDVALVRAGMTGPFATAAKAITVKEAREGTLSTANVPPRFTAGRPLTFTVPVTNTAAPDGETWQTAGAGRVVLRARFGGASPTGYVYAALPAPVAPGSSTDVDVTLTAPSGIASGVPVELALTVAGTSIVVGATNTLADIVPAYRGTLDASTVPLFWGRGRTQTFTVSVQNTAAPNGATWPATGGGGVLVRARFGGSPATSYIYAPLTGDVAPGATGTASVTLTAPSTVAANVIELALLVAGQPPFTTAAPVNVRVREVRQASISATGLPATWSPGQTQTFDVTVTNTGAEIWNASGANPVALLAKMVNTGTGMAIGTVRIVTLAADVAPDGVAVLEVTLTAPANLTNVAVHLQMNKSGVGVIPAALQQAVTPAP